MKILIVDDNEENVYMLQSLFTGEGHEVLPARDGTEALELLTSSGAELIISDILMPRMDGFQLCRAVRGTEAFAGIPFIFYTATYTSEEDRDFALSLGADWFFVKPDDLETLVATVREKVPERIAAAAPPPPDDEMEFCRQHNKALFLKLEKKIADLDVARQTLQSSLRQMSAILNNIPDMAWLKVTEGRFIAVNESFGKACGRSPRDIAGKTDLDIWPQQLADLYCHDDRDVIQTKRRKRVEELLLGRDGKEVWLETIKTPVFDLEGNIIGTTGISRDISDRRLAEEELKKAAEEWHTTFNSTSDLFFLIDTDYRITKVNRAASAFFGVPPEEIVGCRCYELVHGTPGPPPECPLSKLLRSLRHEETELHLNAQDMWVQETVDPILDKKGELLGVVHIVRDTTERKKLEYQLRQSQKIEAVGLLAGGIAHDFNNALNVIIGFGTLVQESVRGDQKLSDNINEVLAAADRAAQLTRRLLVFSRRQGMEIKPVDINKTIADLEKMLVRIIGEDIVLTMELSDREMVVMADSGQIEQVLMNLATNARDAMKKGGRLTIATEAREIDDEYIKAQGYGSPGSYVVISVADTGSGMDRETQEKIFEPFFTTKAVGEGTGLGLSIVYGIVEQHGGCVKVDSEIGKGATFRILLPLTGEERAKEGGADATAPIEGGTEVILVAEDDPSLRKLEAITLESWGYTVITAANGEEAIAKFVENKDRIRLVILDMIMPKISGRDAYEKIRKIRPDIKSLFATGYTPDNLTKQGIHSGVELINKPVAPKDLLKKVRKMLDD